MRLRPSPFQVPTSGDPFVNDTLGRKEQIESLTRLVRNIKGPCVLAIDGAWGSGKTVFLKMWAQFLRKKRFRVAEFNAWETDFSHDPLMALYAALEAELGRFPTPKHKAALKAGGIVVSKMASSVPFVPDVAGAVVAAKEQTETPIKVRLSQHRGAEEAISGFKEALVKATKNRLPLVVCVDELDRCRPDYAIRFLEATKHIFDADGVVFVLAVNLAELEKSVGALYGSNFDGVTYLRRFLDHSFYLTKADRTHFLDDLLESVGLAGRINRGDYIRLFLDTFVLGAPHMSLRDIEQAIHHLGLILNAIPKQQQSFEVPLDILATTLMLFRMVAPDTYRQFTRGEISDLDALDALNRLINRPNDWWKITTPSQEASASAKMEAILTGWGRHIRGSWQTDTPLLQLRRSEAEDRENLYAVGVVSNADYVSTGHYSYLLSLIDMIAYDPPSEA